MESAISRVYGILHAEDSVPERLSEYEKAFWVVQNWDGRKLAGKEGLAELCLCKIIASVIFPEGEIGPLTVRRAALLLEEYSGKKVCHDNAASVALGYSHEI